MKKSGMALVVGLALGFLMGMTGGPRVAQAAEKKGETPRPAACCASAGNGCCAG
jgi:hypothetical protein